MNKLFVGNSTTLQSWANKQFQYLKFDSMTDCLEQVRNDIKVTNKRLSAFYKFKIDSSENKRKRKGEA